MLDSDPFWHRPGQARSEQSDVDHKVAIELPLTVLED
jgi:hypothetical protein